MPEIKLRAEWFWIDRWTGSRAYALPMHARGLYRELLTQAWRRGANLPICERTLRKIVACTYTEWRRAWPLVRPFWRRMPGPNPGDADVYVNDTQLEIYAEAMRRAEIASRRGTTAAHARWGPHAQA
jgi:hypothetical protein